MHRYFAYGSNLNEEDLRKWCTRKNRSYPLGGILSVGYMPDAQLVFNCHSDTREGGVLSYRENCTGHTVPGVVFEIDDEGLAVMDMKEGARKDGNGLYLRKNVHVLTCDGRQTDAITYQVNPLHDRGFVRPHDDYVRVVRAGYHCYELDDDALVKASVDEEPPFLVRKIFTYGTLMRGEVRSQVLYPYNASCPRLALAAGRLIDLGDYPGMILTEDEHSKVLGEVSEMESLSDTLKELDCIEGFKGFGSGESLFRRALVSVVTAGGRSCPAWTYLYNQHHAGNIDIAGGNWRERGAWHGMPVNASSINMNRLVWCIWATSSELVRLKEMIDTDNYSPLFVSEAPWEGADVIISGKPGLGTSKTVVVTEFWRELSWLFNMLKVHFDWHLDSQNKYEFYRFLADAANSCISEAEKIRGKYPVKSDTGQRPALRVIEHSGMEENGISPIMNDRFRKDIMNRVVDSALCILDDLDRYA